VSLVTTPIVIRLERPRRAAAVLPLMIRHFDKPLKEMTTTATEYLVSGFEFAKLLRIPASTIYRALRAGVLVPAARTQREILFRKDRAIDYARSLARFVDGTTFLSILLTAERLAAIDVTELGAHELEAVTIDTQHVAENLRSGSPASASAERKVDSGHHPRPRRRPLTQRAAGQISKR
jgi:hypothetical protein